MFPPIGRKACLALISGALLLGIVSKASAAGLTLSAPPREDVEEGHRLYQPLAAHLSQLLGRSVTYEHPHNWLSYQKGMKAGRFGILFDGPHFIAWRIANTRHTPLVKIAGDLRFYIIARADDNKLSKLADLVGQSLCALPPPHFGTLIAYRQFTNPVRQPITHQIDGGFEQVFAKFMDGTCRAAILPSGFYRRLANNRRSQTKILFKSDAYANQGISVNKTKLSVDERQKIIQSLTHGDGVKVMEPILEKYGDGSWLFIPAKEKQYVPYLKYIEGIRGW